MPDSSLHERFPDRATSWRLRSTELRFGQVPLLVGIVNVTPDSFSDGGFHPDAGAAVDFALRQVDEGAAVVDIGGESTRPYAEPVDATEELRRVLPVIESLVRQTDTPISVDTSKAAVARAAVDAGAQIINDVTGLEGDPQMPTVAAETGAGVCVMHMQGTPQTMQDNPRYGNVLAEVSGYLAARRDALVAAGVPRERICLDPGIGFGKTYEHNLSLLTGCWQLHRLAQPVLVGHSRKGFLATILGDPEADRTHATVGVALSLALQGVQLIRIHDVRPVQEALQAFTATGGVDGATEAE